MIFSSEHLCVCNNLLNFHRKSLTSCFSLPSSRNHLHNLQPRITGQKYPHISGMLYARSTAVLPNSNHLSLLPQWACSPPAGSGSSQTSTETPASSLHLGQALFSCVHAVTLQMPKIYSWERTLLKYPEAIPTPSSLSYMPMRISKRIRTIP